MLEKKEVIDQIEITRDGHVQVRQASLYFEDGIEVAQKYHRHVLSPGDDLAGQADRVRAVAEAIWTPEVVEAYKEAQELLIKG